MFSFYRVWLPTCKMKIFLQSRKTQTQNSEQIKLKFSNFSQNKAMILVESQKDWNPANSGGLSQFLAKQTMRLKPSGRTQINIETQWQKLRSASTNNPKTHIGETKPDRRWDWWTRLTLLTEKSNLRTGCVDDGGAGDELRQQNMEGERRTKRWRVMSTRVSDWLGGGREAESERGDESIVTEIFYSK